MLVISTTMRISHAQNVHDVRAKKSPR